MRPDIIDATIRDEIYYCLFMHFDRAYWWQWLREVGSFKKIDPVLRAHATLPHKSQQVMDRIRLACPATVSRTQIIDDCWDGNMLVGEKGLNHALWTIRLALRDNARNPRFIRTISRQSYSWIGPVERQWRNRPFLRWSPTRAAALPLLLAMSVVLSLADVRFDTSNISQTVKAPDGQSTAYFRGRDIIVKQKADIVLVMKPSGQKRFGNPSYSRDSDRLAFPVYNAGHCELVVVALDKRSYRKFQDCPI